MKRASSNRCSDDFNPAQRAHIAGTTVPEQVVVSGGISQTLEGDQVVYGAQFQKGRPSTFQFHPRNSSSETEIALTHCAMAVNLPGEVGGCVQNRDRYQEETADPSNQRVFFASEIGAQQSGDRRQLHHSRAPANSTEQPLVKQVKPTTEVGIQPAFVQRIRVVKIWRACRVQHANFICEAAAAVGVAGSYAAVCLWYLGSAAARALAVVSALGSWSSVGGEVTSSHQHPTPRDVGGLFHRLSAWALGIQAENAALVLGLTGALIVWLAQGAGVLA